MRYVLYCNCPDEILIFDVNFNVSFEINYLYNSLRLKTISFEEIKKVGWTFITCLMGVTISNINSTNKEK